MKELVCLYLQRRSKEALIDVHQGSCSTAGLLSLPGFHLFSLCSLPSGLSLRVEDCASSVAPRMRKRRAVNLSCFELSLLFPLPKADCCFSASSENGDPLVGTAHSEARAKKTEKAKNPVKRACRSETKIPLSGPRAWRG
jgi:hypothetical protein